MSPVQKILRHPPRYFWGHVRIGLLSVAALSMVLILSACAGMSTDPTVNKIQSATVTCAGITSSINILATMRTAKQLSDSQVATVDAIIPIVEPICGVAHTSGDVIDLDALSDYLFELQKITGGA